MATNNGPVVVVINRCDECPHVVGASTIFWACQHPDRLRYHYALSESDTPATDPRFLWVENVPRGKLPEHPPPWCPWRTKEPTDG